MSADTDFQEEQIVGVIMEILADIFKIVNFRLPGDKNVRCYDLLVNMQWWSKVHIILDHQSTYSKWPSLLKDSLFYIEERRDMTAIISE